MKKIIHNVKGVLFVQRKVEYEQFTQILEVMQGQFKDFAGNEQGLGDLVDSLVKNGVAPKIVRILLRPYEPTPLHRAWNAWRARKTRVDFSDPIQRMSLEQVAGVLLGFFVLNTRSIRRWLNSPTVSALRAEIAPMFKSLIPATPPSSLQQMVSSAK